MPTTWKTLLTKPLDHTHVKTAIGQTFYTTITWLAQHQLSLASRMTNQQIHVDLAVKTAQLEQEVEQRKQAQLALKEINDNLEHEIKLRTQDLENILDELGHVNTQLEQELIERKTLESQLIQAQKLESIGQLAAGVAHEINNPVGFIMSNLTTLEEYSQLLVKLVNDFNAIDEHLETLPLNDTITTLRSQLHHFQRQEDMDFIIEDLSGLLAESMDGTRRVKDIVQGLKSFCRIDESTVQEADLHECLESTLKVVWNELKYKCHVERCYGDIPRLVCNPSQLNQVFMNLLVNAAHAIDDHGTITIITEATNSDITLQIRDTGSGIPKHILEKIFDPFFTTKPVGEGSGLGLAISYGIIQKHNGTIHVESQSGNGTTFTITLPLEDGIQPEGDEPTFNTTAVSNLAASAEVTA